MYKKLSILCSLLIAMQIVLSSISMPVFAEGETATYTPPESPSKTYNMNIDWSFKKATKAYDVSNDGNALNNAIEGDKDTSGKKFYEVGYSQSADWKTVSAPHSVNAEDSYDNMSIDAGEASLYRGFMFYRKEITVPQEAQGNKVFIEFETVRNSVYLWVNGQKVGYYEAGTAPIGFDITPYITAGETAVVAVATDNSSGRGSSASIVETRAGSAWGARNGSGYQWATKDFNPVQGGITGNVNLYIKSNIYQTLPLYSNLKTKGTYVYGSNYVVGETSAENSVKVNVEAEIRNETLADEDVTVQIDIVDTDGNLAATFEQPATSIKKAADAGVKFETIVPTDAYEIVYSADGKKVLEDNTLPTNWNTVDVTTVKFSQTVGGLKLWHPDTPNLYTVYSIVKKADGSVVDVTEITTGFRKVGFDRNKGMIINDIPTDLNGYAQRSTNPWAVIGVANDWLNDIDMQLVKESGSNFIRWMHVTPKVGSIRAGDKWGVVSVVPAGDKEGDPIGRTWDQRMEAMREALIYFRNSPSVIYWEVGNSEVTPDHMKEMYEMKQALDNPEAGRYIGSRTISSVDQLKWAEYVGTMLNRNAESAVASMAALGKYMPIVETEYAREESPKRVWDDFSPPFFDYANKYLGPGGAKTDGYDVYDQTQEDFAIANAKGYQEFYNDKNGGASGKNYYSAAAALLWSDDNQHGRNSSENARASGRVDAVRIKKESFDVFNVLQSTEPKIKILGHWNYPQVGGDNYKYNVKLLDVYDRSVFQNYKGTTKVKTYVNNNGKWVENGEITVGTTIDLWPTWNKYILDYEPKRELVWNCSDGTKLYDDSWYKTGTPVTYYDKEGKEIKGTQFTKTYTPSDRYLAGKDEPTLTKFRDPTKKTVYVMGSDAVKSVELFVNGVSKGKTARTNDNSQFGYAFPNVDVTEKGTVSAKGYDASGAVVLATDEISTVGEAKKIDLQVMKGPDEFRADGSDLVYIDVKIVDENGNVCPLDNSKIDFEISGAGINLGGYNSGYFNGSPLGDSVIRKPYVYAENGVNRIFIQSTRDAGDITVTAKVEGLANSSVTVTSVPFVTSGGLTFEKQRAIPAGTYIDPIRPKVASIRTLGKSILAIFSGDNKNVGEYDDAVAKDLYTVKVANTAVTFAESAYLNGTAVYGEIVPVLDALLEAGKSFSYTQATENGKRVIHISSGGKNVDLIEDEPRIIIPGGESDLQDGAPFVNDSGNLVAELHTIMKHIGATVYLDTANKTLNIS